MESARGSLMSENKVVISLSEEDYQELLRYIRWNASVALSDRNRIAALSLIDRIEDSVLKTLEKA